MSNKTRKKQIENQAQQGRSMVEMLGVLAIIGVISIGGIAGYRMAMNRYQANQIANEINLMRTDAKIKVARGVELLLGSPYDDEKHLNFNANYGVEVKFEEIETDTPGETEKGYSFTLSNIPEGVCRPLVTLLDNMDNTADITIGGKSYYDENANENFCGETNEVMVAFSTKDIGSEKKCNPDKCEGKCTETGECELCPEEMPWNGSACACPSGKHWNGNECISCSGGKVWDGNDCSCPAGAEKSGEDGEECACSTEKPHWNGTECTECPNGSTWDSTTGECKCEGNKVWKESVSGEDKCVEIVGECESNADCGPGEYCYIYYGYNCGDGKEFQSFGMGLHSSYTSECRNARKDIKDGKAGTKSGFIFGKPSVYSGYMDWWSAGRFCEALGRKQATLASTGCDGVPYGEYCQSETRKNLYDDFGDYWVWMYDMYDFSCNAYYVNLNTGTVYDGPRRATNYALCE